MPDDWNPFPPTRHGLPIELHTLADKDFERLCSELFEKEPNIAGCDLYGIEGQKQFGIDLLARESDSHSGRAMQVSKKAFPFRRSKRRRTRF